jgi:cyclophilin family peptidyl-prolyl cis-trans isomerase
LFYPIISLHLLHCSECDFLDGKHVVFGRATEESRAILKKVESYGSKEGSTSATVFVSKAGVSSYYPLAELAVAVAKSAYLDIAVNGKAIGRININLFSNTPITSANFAKFAEGITANIGPYKGDYGYKNTIMHRVIPGFMCQLGMFFDQIYHSIKCETL